MNLENRNIIIVGAGGGIGRVMARRFHVAGAVLVLAGRTKQTLDGLATELGSRAFVVPTDASEPESVHQLFQTASAQLGQVAGVIISVGSWRQVGVDDSLALARDYADEHYQGLFLPALLVGMAAGQFFKLQDRGGLIVHLSSHAAVRPELPGNLTYGPWKATARHLMLALRSELAGTGIRVTDLQPAIVNTPGNRHALGTNERRAQAVQPETIADWLVEHFDNPDIPAEHGFEAQEGLVL